MNDSRAGMVDVTGVLILLANLVVLGLNLKLYTEYFKDQSQRNRRVRGTDEGG
jgi:hypothetical protein